MCVCEEEDTCVCEEEDTCVYVSATVLRRRFSWMGFSSTLMWGALQDWGLAVPGLLCLCLFPPFFFFPLFFQSQDLFAFTVSGIGAVSLGLMSLRLAFLFWTELKSTKPTPHAVTTPIRDHPLFFARARSVYIYTHTYIYSGYTPNHARAHTHTLADTQTHHTYVCIYLCVCVCVCVCVYVYIYIY